MAIRHRRACEAEGDEAKAFGGRQTGNAGRAVADVVGDWWVAVVMECEQLPQWQKDAVAQAERTAAMFITPMPALVVLHEPGQPFAADLVLMRRGEYEVWHGALSDYRGDNNG